MYREGDGLRRIELDFNGFFYWDPREYGISPAAGADTAKNPFCF